MIQSTYFMIFLVLAICWTIIWLGVVYSVSRVAPEAEVDTKTARLRRQLVFPIVGTFLVLLALSIYWAPFPEFRVHTIGQPEVTVEVDSLQWAWIMSEQEIPVDKIVEFNVTSKDVNHGFAIYNEAGRLVAQTQAMPGHINKLIYRFDEAGTYTVRCLEYCGLGHHIMLGSFTVA